MERWNYMMMKWCNIGKSAQDHNLDHDVLGFQQFYHDFFKVCLSSIFDDK